MDVPAGLPSPPSSRCRVVPPSAATFRTRSSRTGGPFRTRQPRASPSRARDGGRRAVAVARLLHVRGRNFGVRGSGSAALRRRRAHRRDGRRGGRPPSAWASAFDMASVAVRANGHTSNVVTAAWRATSCALAMSATNVPLGVQRARMRLRLRRLRAVRRRDAVAATRGLRYSVRETRWAIRSRAPRCRRSASGGARRRVRGARVRRRRRERTDVRRRGPPTRSARSRTPASPARASSRGRRSTARRARVHRARAGAQRRRRVVRRRDRTCAGRQRRARRARLPPRRQLAGQHRHGRRRRRGARGWRPRCNRAAVRRGVPRLVRERRGRSDRRDAMRTPRDQRA